MSKYLNWLTGAAVVTVAAIGLSTSAAQSQETGPSWQSFVCEAGGGNLQRHLDTAHEGETIFFGTDCDGGPYQISGRSVNLRGFSGQRATLSAAGGGDCVLIIENAHVDLSRFDVDATGADDGICVLGGGTVRTTDIEVRNAVGSGIVVRNGGSGTITQSRILDNGGPGVFVFIGGTAAIHDNVIEDNGNVGIQLDGGAHAIITDNQIRRNGAAGIFARMNSGAQIQGNVIEDNTHSGIGVVESGSAQISDNEITGNGISGISVDRNASVLLPAWAGGANLIQGNAHYGLLCGESGSLEVAVAQNYGTGNAPGNEQIDPGCHYP